MALKLQVVLLVGTLIFITIIINMLRKEKVELKYTLIWIITGILMLIIVINPALADGLARLMGIEVTVNAVFYLALLFVLLITFSLTIALSRQSIRVKELAQELALLEYSSAQINQEYSRQILELVQRNDNANSF